MGVFEIAIATLVGCVASTAVAVRLERARLQALRRDLEDPLGNVHCTGGAPTAMSIGTDALSQFS